MPKRPDGALVAEHSGKQYYKELGGRIALKVGMGCLWRVQIYENVGDGGGMMSGETYPQCLVACACAWGWTVRYD